MTWRNTLFILNKPITIIVKYNFINEMHNVTACSKRLTYTDVLLYINIYTSIVLSLSYT